MIEQEKMIVEALPSLYPLQKFEEDAVHAVIDALPHWIPATEKLPKDGQYILAYYPEFECGCLVQKYRTIGNYGFVAWMPLPEPFKGVTS